MINSVPAIAVIQRVQGDSSINRPKGCVGSLLDLALQTGCSLGISLLSVEWNFAEVKNGIVTGGLNLIK